MWLLRQKQYHEKNDMLRSLCENKNTQEEKFKILVLHQVYSL